MLSKKQLVSTFFDIFFLPFIFLSSIILKIVRKLGIENMPLSKNIFNNVGVFPITDHYYEPNFNNEHLRSKLSIDRSMVAIDMNISNQLKIMEQFNFNNELIKFPVKKKKLYPQIHFYYDNPQFKSGDAEYLYNIIRLYKPNNIIEIGSGFSTLLAICALDINRNESLNHITNHICIEPYENIWLDSLNVTTIRKTLEKVDKSLFAMLNKNDILFIDSSHVIKPQGDVVIEYLEVLPILNSGVIIHIHDIFTPRDYLEEWICDRVRLWNEQYLLEAFLSFNKDFEIIGALNYLSHHYPDHLSRKCPIYAKQKEFREPGSFWLKRK